MQAIILAGGPQRRIRPINADTSKFMLPFFDCPVIEHAVRLLVRQGFDDIVISLARESTDVAEYLGDGRRFGASIRYCVEAKPLGTAGALKAIEHILEETFVVFPGDLVTDVDLLPALAFHRAHSPAATVITAPSDDPTAHTCLRLGDSNKVVQVLVKPSAKDAVGTHVSTGLVILNRHAVKRVPPFESRDIDRDVLPRLMREAEWVKAYHADCRWADVGTVLSYKAVHFDALEGRLKTELSAQVVDPDIWVGERVQIDPTAEIVPPVYLGSGTVVGPRAIIGPRAVIGENTAIEDRAVVRASIIGRGCRIASGSSIIGCLLGTHYCTDEEESMFNCSAFNSANAEFSAAEMETVEHITYRTMTS
ncbi:MAG: NDP-sugar synthase [Armatimonadota bacterium]|nr:NDP-sugar synthase [Armatimonadota bacterium]